MSTYFITGGAGFIGSSFVLQMRQKNITIVNLDKLTYSGNLDNLISLKDDPGHIFICGDIGNYELIYYLLSVHKPSVIVNFAAESHVDRSIHDPDAFINTNVLGTSTLLRAALDYWKKLDLEKQKSFRFLHISTDEVFGSLQKTDSAFTESSKYAPNSPYSASKAASDHFVRAFNETYGLPTIISNCSNNYGPRQFPEKLVPLIILNALAQKPLPIYGNGENIRDWLHVEDHCQALQQIIIAGKVGESYNIGGNCELSNIYVVNALCNILDELRPSASIKYNKLIRYVKDRLGHDFRYAIDCTKIEQELNWKPKHDFEQGLKETVCWYLENEDWVSNIHTGAYKSWLKKNYT